MFKYLKTKSDYPTDLIYEHIIRVGHMANIWRNLQLTYILPDNYVIKPDPSNKRVALMMHVYFEDKIQESFKYAKSMPEYADVYVTTDTPAKKAAIEEVFGQLNVKKIVVILIENRGRDVSALLVGCKPYIDQYDYICFVHDKKVTQFDTSIGESFAYKCLENTLRSREFVDNVINAFKDEPRLGLLSPMYPNHGPYQFTLIDSWTPNLENTIELLESFDIDLPIDKKYQPIAPLGTMFWFRAKAFKTLLSKDWEYTDFPPEPNNTDGTLLHAVERGYPFFAQHDGFVSGFLYFEDFTKMEISNMTRYLFNADIVYKPLGHWKNSSVDVSKTLKQLERQVSTWQKIKNKVTGLLIRKHKLFDEEYYLSQYSDIKDCGMRPIRHFIEYGVYEFRNPSEDVNTATFYFHNQNLFVKGKNILFHFIED